MYIYIICISFIISGHQVKVVTCKEEQQRILTVCHNEPTSGHFGVTKTSKRVGERFYWKGMMADITDLVSKVSMNLVH